MVHAKFNLGRTFLVRVEHDSDLVQFLTEFAKKEKVTMAAFTAIGALKRAKLGFYEQKKHAYQEMTLNTPNEIASCVGNISVKDGNPFVHAHAVLADKNGDTKAGHLVTGKVFAAEVHLWELMDTVLERKFDNVTGLSLWHEK